MLRIDLFYAMATMLVNFSWGVFFTFMTKYIGVELGGGEAAVVLFTGANWFYTLLGLFAGKVSSTIGERKTVLLGLFCSIPILLGYFITDPYYLALTVSIASFPWVLSWSAVLKAVFSLSSRDNMGRYYGKITIGSGLGFFFGSIVTGLIIAVLGLSGVYVVVVLTLTVSYLIYYYKYPTFISESRVKNTSIVKITINLLPALISLSLIVFIRELLYSLAPIKLNNSIEALTLHIPKWLEYTIYGLIYSGGALISPVARIIAGKLVDKYGPLSVYISVVLSYTALYWAFGYSSGIIPVILWQIPLYPLLDTSFNVFVAMKLSSEELTSGFGLVYAFTAIGGLMLLPLLLLNELNIVYIGIFVSAAGILSILLILLSAYRNVIS
ncbi:MAG: MFS transporter [Desulfurococcaceae archaeon]